MLRLFPNSCISHSLPFLRIEQILNGEEFECTWSLALRKTVISRSSHNDSCIASSG